MIVKCIAIRNNLPAVVLPYDIDNPWKNDDDFVVIRAGYDEGNYTKKYSLTLDREYEVYGILIYGNSIRYLLSDDENMPCFFPSDLFLIKDRFLYYDWEITHYIIDKCQYVLMGYSALIENYASFRDLVDWSPNAIKKFLDYKATLTNYGR